MIRILDEYVSTRRHPARILEMRRGVPVLLDADSVLEIDAQNPAHSNGCTADSGVRFGKSPAGLADRAGRDATTCFWVHFILQY